MQRYILLLFLFIGLLACSHSATAQDFVYRPTNPAFGGDTFNYNWLLSSAEAQNSIEDPDRVDRSLTGSTLDDFTESLNRNLLSQLSRSLVSNQFGSDGLEDGTYQIGNYQIDVNSNLDGIIINVFDNSTGESTEIVIPFY
ncbi:MAG: curli production assembly/transport component CsgF [Bacteroidota bacterium]